MKKYSMLLIACLCTCVSTLLYSAADDTHQFLEHIATIVDPNDAQKEIRWQLRGDRNACHALFKEVVATDNMRAQLYCTNAYYAMRWDRDDQKDFTQITKNSLESHRFASAMAVYLEGMYKDNSKVQAQRIMQRAATAGCPLARLADLKTHSSRQHNFLYAYRLQKEFQHGNNHSFPFHEAAYEYGRALLGAYNRQFSLEGLKHMADSGFLEVHGEDEKTDLNLPFGSFDQHTQRTIIVKRQFSHNQRYGMQFSLLNEILAPSHAYWQQFKREYLDTLPLVSAPFFKIFEQHDIARVSAILQKLNISAIMISHEKKEPRESLHLSSSRWNNFGKITRETHGGMIESTLYIPETEKNEFAPALAFLTAAYIQLQTAEDMHTLIINLKEDKS